jgi:hypothetical protein
MSEIATPPSHGPGTKCLPSAAEIAEAKQTRADIAADPAPKAGAGRKPLFGK